MRILFDHCVPKPFRRELPGHEIKTAYQMGWSDLDNGELLSQAAKEFQVFLMVDQNLHYQQNLRQLPIPVVMLISEDNDPDTLKAYAPAVLVALSRIRAGDLLQIHGDGHIQKMTQDDLKPKTKSQTKRRKSK